MRAAVQVFTFREGILARLAHDLRLHAQVFEITLDRGRVTGFVEAASLVVDGVARGDVVEPDALSAADKQRIWQTLSSELLHTERYPRVELEGQVAAGGREIDAVLRLTGKSLPQRITLAAGSGRVVAELSFAPSSFGIAPYRALGGAIRLQDRVVVRASVEHDDLSALLASQDPVRFHA